jgi:hypothetical protein
MCLMGMLASAALARQATVTTHDGRIFRGEVETESDKGIKLNIAGISTLIPRQDIKDVKIELTVAEEYRQRRAALPDDDLNERYRLASWLYDRKGYDLALRELSDLAERFPDDGRITSLLNLVEAKIKLLREREAQQAAATPTPPMTGASAPPDATASPTPNPDAAQPLAAAIADAPPIPLLTEEQINRIKVYEVDLNQRPPARIVIPRDAVMEFLDAYGDRDSRLRGTNDRRRFLTMSGAEQLGIMFDLKAREFYGRVDVRDDPAAMLTFKRLVNRQIVVNHCGTVRCHGGPNAGEFRLVLTRQLDDQTVYTNFYLLNSWNRGLGYMIDRTRPQESYMVQYAMPREMARYPHPQVDGFRPQFHSRDNAIYTDLIDWIEQLYSPAPDYDIDYKLPWGPVAEEDGAPTDEPDAGRTGTTKP